MVLSGYADDPSLRAVDTVDLGRGSWCRATLTDPAASADLNATPPAALALLLGDTLADALLDWRDADDLPRPFGAEADWYRAQKRAIPRNGPFAAVGELALVRGFEGLGPSTAALFSVDGTGRMNPNLLPRRLLPLLGLDPESIEAVVARRGAGRPLASVDELAGSLSGGTRAAVMMSYRELQSSTVWGPERFVMDAEGGVRGSGIAAAARLIVIPLAGRLAVVRREME
jgi:hypothetical protein